MSDFEFFYNVNGADDETFALIGNKTKRKERRAERQAKRQERRGRGSSSQQSMAQAKTGDTANIPVATKMGETPKSMIGKKAIDLLPPEYIAALEPSNLKQTLNQAKINELSNELEGLTEQDLSNNDFVTQAKAIIDKYVVVVPSEQLAPENANLKSLTPDSGTSGEWWDTLDNSKKVMVLVAGIGAIVGISYVMTKYQK